MPECVRSLLYAPSMEAHGLHESAQVELRDGRSIPQLGYGVWQVEDEDAADVVGVALAAGYRHVDTAMIYHNECGVGDGIRRSEVDRDEVFVTTKLWNDDQGFDATLAAFDASLDRLGFEHVDMYLIHWPAPIRGDDFVESWKALARLREEGRARSIGTSNFHAEHLDRIIDATGTVPAINQVELHPYFPQTELREYHRAHGIATEAWSPLGQGRELLADPVVAGIAAAHQATPAQVVLAWHLAHGIVAIPKSVTPSRIEENFAATSLHLSDHDLAALDGLDRGPAGRIGPNPETAMF